MSGTVGPAAKREIIARLAALPALSGVQVTYSISRDLERESIYLGKVGGPVTPAAMRAGSRLTRREDLILQLVVWVRTPGEPDVEAAEDRAVEIGRSVEEMFAGDPTLSDAVDGLKFAFISNVDLDAGLDDDGAAAELIYQVTLTSHVR